MSQISQKKRLAQLQKQLRLSISKQHYPTPHEKEFIAFSMIVKESNSGFKSHKRLLILDSKNKSLSYCRQIPTELPSVQKELPEAKQFIDIRKTRIFSFKSTRTNIGKVKVEWLDLNGKKSQWNLAFANNQIMSQWVFMVNQVVKDGHLHPENRPKSSTRRESKVNASKYMTEFMRQTKNQNSQNKQDSRNSSASKIPFWAKNIKKEEQDQVGETRHQQQENLNDGGWLLKRVAQKQKQINNNLKKRQEEQEALRKKQKEEQEKQKQRKLQEQKLKTEREQIPNKNISDLRPKTLEQSFLSRQSMHRGKKVEKEQVKQKQKMSREEQFRKKLIQKAIQKSKVNSSSNSSKQIKMNEIQIRSPTNTYNNSINTDNIPTTHNRQHKQNTQSQTAKYFRSQIIRQENNPTLAKLKENEKMHTSAIQRTIDHQRSPKNNVNIINRMKEMYGQDDEEIEPLISKKQQLVQKEDDKINNFREILKKDEQIRQNIQDRRNRREEDSYPSNFRYSTPQNYTNQNHIKENRSRNTSKNNSVEQQKFRERIKTFAYNNIQQNIIEHQTHGHETHYKNQYADHPYIQTAYHHSGISNSAVNYQKFMKKSEQIARVLIDQFQQMIEEARKHSTKILYIKQSPQIKTEGMTNKTLHVQRSSIHYQIQFESSKQQISPNRFLADNWYEGAFRMQQYTSIVRYLKQMLKRKKLPNFSNRCIILPFCIINYKWNMVICKSTIPETFKSASIAEIEELNKLLEVPSRTLQYYIMRDPGQKNSKILLIDYAASNLKIQSDFPNEAVQEIVTKLQNQSIVFGSISDLVEQLSFTYSKTLNEQIIGQLLKQLNKKIYLSSYNKHPSTFSICFLYSLLYGIKCSEYIQKVLSKHMFDMEPGQLIQNINQLTHLALTKNIDRYNNHVSTAIVDKYRQFLELSNIRIPQNNEITDSIVLSTILYVLGLEIRYLNALAPSHNYQMQQQVFLKRGPQSSSNKLNAYTSQEKLIFVSKRYGIGGESFIEDLDSVKKILLKVISLEENEQQKYPYFLQLQTLLKKYAASQLSKQPKSIKQGSPSCIYLNLTTRVNLFRSIYTPTMSINLPSSLPTDQFSQIVWSQPPSRFSFLLGINCTKWAIKKRNKDPDTILKIIQEQIKNCKFWVGKHNYYLILFYEVAALYCSSLFDYDSAIHYTKLCLEAVHINYGQGSSNSIQKWFHLANMQLQAQLYQQSLISYTRSLDLLTQKTSPPKKDTNRQSKHSLISINTENIQISKCAELELRNKIAQIHLAMGNIDESLHESMLCLKLYQDAILEHNLEEIQKELEILFRVVRCYEIKKSVENLEKMEKVIEIIGSKFPTTLVQKSHPREQLDQDYHIQSQILKICLYPYLTKCIQFDTNRKDYLRQTITSISKDYKNRYTIHQYHGYITKWLNNQHASHSHRTSYNFKPQKVNIFPKIKAQLSNLPIYHQKQDTLKKYTLYQDSAVANKNMIFSFSPKESNQGIKSVQSYRILESIGNIVGFTYLKNCF